MALHLDWDQKNKCSLGPIKLCVNRAVDFGDGTSLYQIYLMTDEDEGDKHRPFAIYSPDNNFKVIDRDNDEIAILCKVQCSSYDEAKHIAEKKLKDIICAYLENITRDDKKDDNTHV